MQKKPTQDSLQKDPEPPSQASVVQAPKMEDKPAEVAPPSRPAFQSSSSLGSPETPSIFKRKPKAAQDQAKAVQEDRPQQVLADRQEEVFDTDQLAEAWKAFAESKKDKAGEMEQLILTRPLALIDSGEVCIQLRSTLEVSILERFEHEMIAFLRKQLKNDTILLKKEIQEEEQQTQKLYTSADKFDYMVKQNPDLKLLKERLGLDFEY